MLSISQLLSQDEVTSVKTLNNISALSPQCSVEQQAKMLEYELIEERLQPYIVDMTKPLPDIEPLISIDGNPVCTRGNISAICGEAKSRKTFLTTALVASAMAIPCNKLDNFSNVSKDKLSKYGFKNVFSEDELLTRDELSELFGIDFNDLIDPYEEFRDINIRAFLNNLCEDPYIREILLNNPNMKKDIERLNSLEKSI